MRTCVRTYVHKGAVGQVAMGGTGDYIGVVRLFGVVLVWKVVSIYPSFKSI